MNNPMVQTVLELDSVDYSSIRLTPEQSQKVGNQLYNTLVGEKELFYRGEFVKLENLSYFAEILSRLAEFGNLPSRIADIRATGNRYLVVNDAQRLTIVKSLSEKLHGSPRVYIDFLTAFLGGNNFALTDKFGRVEFNANNGKRFTLSQSKDEKGVLSGNIIYTVQGVSNGKVIEERVYDNIKLMDLHERRQHDVLAVADNQRQHPAPDDHPHQEREGVVDQLYDDDAHLFLLAVPDRFANAAS